MTYEEALKIIGSFETNTRIDSIDKLDALMKAMEALEKQIQKKPTVDAVPVVRCKDCMHDGLSTCPMCYIENHTLCFVNHDANFFCAKGETK